MAFLGTGLSKLLPSTADLESMAEGVPVILGSAIPLSPAFWGGPGPTPIDQLAGWLRGSGVHSVIGMASTTCKYGAVALMVALVGTLTGLVAPSPAGAASAEPAAPDVADFLDRTIADQLTQHQIPGAAVVVVAGGRQVFARGYGLADLERQRPVAAESTGFFIGSTAKLLTATAVMQQVEQGGLDLHTDVNKYLTEFRVRDTYPGRPVTLAHLLTHTAGFEEDILGIASADPADLPALGDYLAGHQPARVRPPGELASYSNYGLALAGHLVERAAGMPFDAYLDEHLLRPLDMTGTSFAQPAPEPIRAKLARGYRPDGAGQRPARGQYSPMAPAGGGVVATVPDLGRFMLAQLQGGQIDGVRILDEASIAQMQTRQFTHDPRLPGTGYGFIERYRNGQRLLTHPGDNSGFHGNLTLLPEHEVGIYVVYNGDGVDDGAIVAGQQLVDGYVDRFYPGEAEAGAATDADQPVDRYAGTYRTTRISHSDFTRFAALTTAVTVTAHDDGTLTTSGPLSPDPARSEQRWEPVGPQLFQEAGGQDRFGFAVDDQGRVTALFTSADPTVAYERLAWYESPDLHLAVAGAALLVLLPALLGWPVAAAWRAGRRRWEGLAPRHAGRAGRGARFARLLAWTTAALLVWFVAGLAMLLTDFAALTETIMLGGSPTLTIVLALPTVATAAAAGTVACAVVAWWRRWWSLPRRLYFGATTLAALAFLGVAASYQLVF